MLSAVGAGNRVDLPGGQGGFLGSEDPSEGWVWMWVARKGPGRSKGPGADMELRKMRASSMAGERLSSGEIRLRRLPSVQPYRCSQHLGLS